MRGGWPGSSRSAVDTFALHSLARASSNVAALSETIQWVHLLCWCCLPKSVCQNSWRQLDMADDLQAASLAEQVLAAALVQHCCMTFKGVRSHVETTPCVLQAARGR
jgi:hypothetical protein